MNLRFKVLVLRLLMAIYTHQICQIRVLSEERRQVILDAEDFIYELVQKEKEE